MVSWQSDPDVIGFTNMPKIWERAPQWCGTCAHWSSADRHRGLCQYGKLDVAAAILWAGRTEPVRCEKWEERDE